MRRPPPVQDWIRYPVTSTIAVLAILVTAARLGGMDFSFLYAESIEGKLQFWGLVTSIFPHVDPIHLIFNLFWLWVFGSLLEGAFGPIRTAGIMLLFAIGSSAAEFAASGGGIGLSGVAYGLFGLFWVLSKRDLRFRDSIDNQTIFLFVFWFFCASI